MMNKQHSVYRLPLLAALGLSLFGAVVAVATPLGQSRLEVRLIDKQTGIPVADAAVCLGTGARMDQFGAERTDNNGIVRFDDSQPHPLLLTVSRAGYQGRQQALEPMYASRVLVVTLVTGGGGPVCDAPPPAPVTGASSGLSVDSITVRVDSASDRVRVSTRTSAPVNEIRVSEHADFRDASWQPYTATVAYAQSSGLGVKRLYVQVRRATQTQGASIEAVSPVKQVSYLAR